MPDTTLMQLPFSQAAHLNNGLFADHFLDKVVPQEDEWKALKDEARPVFEALRTALRNLHPEVLDEGQLEERWIKAVFDQVGWHYNVQVKIRFGPTGYRKPDYALTAERNQANALDNHIYIPRELVEAGVLAVADAKKWGIPLDRASGTERNPSQQIDEYLRYSELPWGILTDGRIWRLYERDSSKNNVYYAVDLKTLLENGKDDTLDKFLYFYAFFRKQAFLPGDWLARTLNESVDYARKLSESLEEQVFDALELIAQGFLDYRRNHITVNGETTLHTLYQQSLVLLYRLLFILYAESRDILPVIDNKKGYQAHSLYALKHKIAAELHKDDWDANAGNYYAHLSSLFFYIDQGEPAFNLPAYNGGLFSAEEHPFLDKNVVGDKYLADAIDKLARVKDDHGMWGMVDYRDLEVRHLGAIYEKLLDYELDIATEPKALKNGEYVKAGPNDELYKAVGQVYLRTGSNQRKVTGSYYTPDYVVRFIVQRTLEPLLSAITERYATRAEDGHWIVPEQNRAALREAILALNVLDPATGSGHFLVDAMAYVAEWLRGLALAPGDLASGEDELLYWKRQVVLACLYGVDVNPLAVELAKLSLWLATLSRGKPLSFLDHHVRCGDSLVGAWSAQIGLIEEANRIRRNNRPTAIQPGASAPSQSEQIPLLAEPEFAPTVGFAVGRMRAIEGVQAANVAEVKQQEAEFAALTEKLDTWRHVADAWTARRFGAETDKQTWGAIRSHFLYGGAVFPDLRKLIERGQAIAAERNFLHWELTFPEVFFEPDGTAKANPGFDAVLGNPPYVRQKSIRTPMSYLAAQYGDVYDGDADLYVYFYGQGLQLLKHGGRLGYIASNKWFRAGYGEGLRTFLGEKALIHEIVDFDNAPIFKDADTFTAIVVFERLGTETVDAPARVTAFPRDLLKVADLSEYTRANSHHVSSGRFTSQPWSLETDEAQALMEKICNAGIPLQEYTGLSAFRGLLTGFNEAFLIDTPTKERLINEDPKAAEIIKPFLRGENIKRWSPEWDNQWLILLKSSENAAWSWKDKADPEAIFAHEYPSLYGFMKPHETRLRRRQDHGRYWWELRSCAYYEQFEKSKVVYQDIQTYPAYSYDTNGYFTNNTCFVLPNADLYLLGVLNSPLMWWYNFRYLPHAINEALRPFAEKMVDLPIAAPSEATRAEVEPAVRRLIALTGEKRERIGILLDWLRVQMAVETPGQKLESFATLSEDEFIEEVIHRRPRRSTLTSAAQHSLKVEYQQGVQDVGRIDGEAAQLERRLSELVIAAYGLTAAEVDLLWKTAPPRMPGSR